MIEKQTVGQASYELLQKPAEKISVIDFQQEAQKSVAREIDDIITKHKTYASEYYIVYMLKRERLMPNVLRQYFIARKSRPAPDYDCTLFSYSNETNELKYHWTIPDADTCAYLMINRSTLSSEEQLLASFVEKFSSGTLV